MLTNVLYELPSWDENRQESPTEGFSIIVQVEFDINFSYFALYVIVKKTNKAN